VQFFLDRYSGARKGKKEPALGTLGLELVGIVMRFREGCAQLTIKIESMSDSAIAGHEKRGRYIPVAPIKSPNKKQKTPLVN